MIFRQSNANEKYELVSLMYGGYYNGYSNTLYMQWHNDTTLKVELRI